MPYAVLVIPDLPDVSRGAPSPWGPEAPAPRFTVRGCTGEVNPSRFLPSVLSQLMLTESLLYARCVGEEPDRTR